MISEKSTSQLPPHHPYNLKINLKEGTTPSFSPLYSKSRDKLLVLEKRLRTDLKQQFISPSSSETGALILFVYKPRGGLRFYMDYQNLNEITIKDRYPSGKSNLCPYTMYGMCGHSTLFSHIQLHPVGFNCTQMHL